MRDRLSVALSGPWKIIKTRVTIADVARAAGVGLSTVDRVMNGRRAVKPATAARVLETAERLGFDGSAAIRDRVKAQSG